MWVSAFHLKLDKQSTSAVMSLCASYITALNGQLENAHVDNESPKRVEERLYKKMPTTTKKATTPPTTRRRRLTTRKTTSTTRRTPTRRRRLPVTTSTSTSTTTTTTLQGSAGGYIPAQRIVHFDLKVINAVRMRSKKALFAGSPANSGILDSTISASCKGRCYRDHDRMGRHISL